LPYITLAYNISVSSMKRIP